MKSRSCILGNNIPQAIAPNPSPDRWEMLNLWVYANAYVMKVRYLDCTNFEGVKIMVYHGEYTYSTYLDPHFQEDSSLVARFAPTAEGTSLALDLAEYLSGESR